MPPSARTLQNARLFMDRMIAVQQAHVLLPAVGVGIVKADGSVHATQVTGVRRHGHSDLAQHDDRFAIGSISKPVTGYLIARLVDRGVLSWTTSIGDVFPEAIAQVPAAWREHYRKVCIADLMTHTSGLTYEPKTESETMYDVIAHDPWKRTVEKRAIYAALAILDKPFTFGKFKQLPNGKQELYSGGCIIAAAMAERRTGKTYEQLMNEEVFGPLGMTRASLRPTSAGDATTGLWNHQFKTKMESRANPDPSNTHVVHGPAGIVSLSMDSMAQLLLAVLRNDRGANTPKLLKQDVHARYVTPGVGDAFTAGGWSGGADTISHNGNDYWSYAFASMDKVAALGAFACTNIWRKPAKEGENGPVEVAIGTLVNELLAFAAHFEIAETLHLAVPSNELVATADSVFDNSGQWHAPLMIDAWFSTRWASKSTTPTFSLLGSKPRSIQGVVFCEVFGQRIQDFDLEIVLSDPKARPKVLSGSALAPHIKRSKNGLVTTLLLPDPVDGRGVRVRVRSASDAPTINQAFLLQAPLKIKQVKRIDHILP